MKNRRFHSRQTTFRQLEIFQRVAELSSVSLACKDLHLAQSTVSTQIAKLADALGASLFEQIGKQMYLTDVGREVLHHTQELFAVMDNLETRIAEHQGLSRGQLKISVVTTAKYLIPKALGHFCEEFTNI